jgi:glutamate/aspartate transport system substrate-binding protein
MLIAVSSKVRKIEDLEGAKVAVVPGTTNERFVKERLSKAGIHANVVPVPDHADGVAALEAGTADVYVSDRSILIAAARNAKDPAKLLLGDQALSYEPYGLVVRRNDAEFRLIADRTLARLYRSDEIASLFTKWFGAMGAAPSNLLTAMYVLSSIPE